MDYRIVFDVPPTPFCVPGDIFDCGLDSDAVCLAVWLCDMIRRSDGETYCLKSFEEAGPPCIPPKYREWAWAQLKESGLIVEASE